MNATVSMERARRVRALWNYLPAFRAVAETEHLPTAAAALFVGPSSLSRTIRILEDDLGQPLFDRVGRSLRLNPAGEALLAAARDAMRLLDDVVESLADDALVGPVRLSIDRELAGVLAVPALAALMEQHPGLQPHVSDVGVAAVEAMLLRGDLDVAVVEDPPPGDAVAAEPLGAVTRGVYCGAAHPLAARRRVTVEDVLAYPFAATDDRWPAQHRRAIGLRAADAGIAMEACHRMSLLAVLVDAVVRADPRGGTLVRLGVEAVAPTRLFALHRIPVGTHRKTEAIVAALRHTAAQL